MRARGRTLLAAALLALAISVAPASAHDQPFSAADVRFGTGRVALELTLHAVDAATLLRTATPESLMAPSFLHRHDERLAALVSPRVEISADGAPLALRWRGSDIRAERHAIVLRFDAPCPRRPGRLRIGARLFPEDSQHETFLDVSDGDRLLRQDVLTAERPAADVYTAGPAGVWAVLLVFVPAGIHHILIGPDHILFLIGLLLLGGTWQRVLKIATGFTVAHSITLALAALGLFQPPARVIEPAIALSVALVGLDNLREHHGRDRRALLAFAFGFIHGFGFASVLRETGLPQEALGWSLFAFNVGVEVGQALVIAAVLPLLSLLRSRAPRWAPRLVTAGSWGVILAGGGWLVQRILVPA